MASKKEAHRAAEDGTTKFRLSSRGAANFTQDDPWGPIEKALSNPWSPENPSGMAIMRLAENSLMHNHVTEFIQKKATVDAPIHLTYGRGPRGSPRLRKALASFLNSNFSPLQSVTDDQIIVMSGVSSIIEAFTWSVCDEGDGVLIPQPLYTGYQMDIAQRSRAILVPVPFHGISGYSSLDDAFQPGILRVAFERALKKAEEDGIRIKAVILSNPHNPLGRCYPVMALQEIAGFCGKHRLHLVSNEIYANSVYENPNFPEAAPFSSILSVDLNTRIDLNLVHVFYGASKDFCMNGFRIGMIQSRSEGLLAAMASLSPFSWTPYLTQDVWASMLEDRSFTSQFFANNKSLLGRRYALATSLLDEHGILYYMGSNAGMFIWIDLRRYIRGTAEISALRRGSYYSHIFEKREAVLDGICLKNGVSIARGSIFFTEEWGWFRLTFTLPEEALIIGIERLMKSLADVEQLGWGTCQSEKGKERLNAVLGHLNPIADEPNEGKGCCM